MPTQSHVGWGLAISLLLHGTGIAALSFALPRLNVRPGVVRQVEFAVLAAPEEAERVTDHAAATAAEPVVSTAAVDVSAEPLQAPAPPPLPANRKPVTKPPLTAATPTQLPSSRRGDPGSDGTALQRVLQQIAGTTALTQDERRKAMLVVLRTWEDPSGKRSADELIDALLENSRKGGGKPSSVAPVEQ